MVHWEWFLWFLKVSGGLESGKENGISSKRASGDCCIEHHGYIGGNIFSIFGKILALVSVDVEVVAVGKGFGVFPEEAQLGRLKWIDVKIGRRLEF